MKVVAGAKKKGGCFQSTGALRWTTFCGATRGGSTMKQTTEMELTAEESILKEWYDNLTFNFLHPFETFDKVLERYKNENQCTLDEFMYAFAKLNFICAKVQVEYYLKSFQRLKVWPYPMPYFSDKLYYYMITSPEDRQKMIRHKWMDYTDQLIQSFVFDEEDQTSSSSEESS